MIPPLIPGSRGHMVLPAGCHPLTWHQLMQGFALGRPDEHLRLSHLKDLGDFLQVLRGHGLFISSVLVDGSFTTDKTGPSDIDCSPVIDGAKSSPSGEIRDSITDNWISPGGKYKRMPVPGLGRTLGLDIFGVVRIPPEHPNHAAGRDNELHWRNYWQFQRGSEGIRSKGYVEVTLDDATI